MPVVNISMFEGRSDEAKQKIAKDVTESIAKNAGVDPQYIYIIFEDVAPKNWAVAGEVYAETLKKQGK
ncbi:MAG TPA: 2-hydroxymuconate tautomerase [Cellvibrio sp.]|nr:2-hydroxymuconate tautomerase [Cellvibrio sp.]